MIDIAAIGREIAKGCPNEAARRDRSKRNVDCYRGDFDMATVRGVDGEYEPAQYQRTTLIMQQAINKLAAHLYAKGPAREFPESPDLAGWLQATYARAGVDALWQEADRLALAGDLAAFQVVATGDPANPVRFHLWPAGDLAVFVAPDDPLRPLVVIVFDEFDATRRARLWTAEVMQTWTTTKFGDGQTSGGTAFTLTDEAENYYGVLPFAFVHAVRPTTQFHNSGPGDCLRLLNEWLNFSMTDCGDSVRYTLKPVLKTFGANNKPPRPLRPGAVWDMAGSAYDDAGNVIAPTADYLQPDPSFVDVHWSDSQSYLDSGLQSVGVPPATVRMVATDAKSGFAIIAEQLPLILWAIGRQRPFAGYEADLARVTIAVAAAELANLGAAVPPWLDPGAADAMTLRWPSMVPDVPLYGAEADAQDSRNLALGLVSRIMLTMKKFNMSRDQALAHLEAVAADLADEAKLGLPALAPQAITQAQTEEDNADAANQ